MRFRTRLLLGFGSVILVLSIIFYFLLQTVNNQHNEMIEIVNEEYEKIKNINQIHFQIGIIDQELNDISEHSDTQLTESNLEAIERANKTIEGLLLVTEKLITTEEAMMIMSSLKEDYASYESAVQKIMIIDQHLPGEELLEKVEVAETESEEIASDINELVGLLENKMENSLQKSTDSYNHMIMVVVILFVISIIIGSGMAIVFVRNVIQRLNRVSSVMNKINYEDQFFPRIHASYSDEIGEIAQAYNEMANALEEHGKIEREYTENVEKQNWVKTKVANLSLLSQGVLDLQELGSLYISYLSKTVGASFGVIYFKEITESHVYFSKLASYAYIDDNVSYGKNKIKLGEGLVGQCAKENQQILLNNVPSNYVKVSSGLGDSTPSAILLVPVEFEGKVLAVIELATTGKFTPIEQSVIEEAIEQLGITFNRIEKHLQLEELLKESQVLNEELQTQSEELQTQQEELRTMNDELEAQYLNSEMKTKELEKTKVELEERNREVVLASRYKSEFLANMSHELRTPLNSLIILAQMLYENKTGNLTEKQVEYATTIYSSGVDLLRLINDILDLSKIESGKIEIQETSVVLDDIITSVKRQFSPIAERSGVELVITKAENLPEEIPSDEQKIYQILKNLLSNAFKFTEVGSIRVKVEKTITPVDDQKEYLAFSVIDTGLGIPINKQDIIFEAFRQVDGTTSRKYGGTGLGLSISKELAHLLGGFITLTSMEGKGSTFTLFLPLQEGIGEIHQLPHLVSLAEVAGTTENVKEEHEPTVANLTPITSLTSDIVDSQFDKTLSGKKILVVDDDMRNIFALTSALESACLEVIFGENGIEALELLEEHDDIDLILMDIMMPEMDGYTAMKEIRKNTKYDSMPMIALTAKAMKHDRQKCIDAGASDYISKPVKLDQLFSLLKVWLHE